MADAEPSRIATIIKQTRNLYRQPSLATTFSVASRIESAVHLPRTKIRSSPAVLEQQVDVDTRLTAQFGELRQVFPNLISNSLHAAGEGGKIRLRARTPA